jgi:hypothetical protein
MATMWATHNYPYLAIIYNPKGKVYTVVTPAVLAERIEQPEWTSQRLILHCTKKELLQMFTTEQQTLFN